MWMLFTQTRCHHQNYILYCILCICKIYSRPRHNLYLWLILMVWFRFTIMSNIKVDIRPSYESIVWASLLQHSRDCRHILCCRLTDYLNMSRGGIAACASRYIFIQFYRVNITSGTFLHWWSNVYKGLFYGGRYFWVENLDRELKHNPSMLRIPNVSVYFLGLVWFSA